MAKMTDDDLKRYAANVKIDEHGCWLWTGELDSEGYGLFEFNGEKVRADQVSLKYFKDPKMRRRLERFIKENDLT